MEHTVYKMGALRSNTGAFYSHIVDIGHGAPLLWHRPRDFVAVQSAEGRDESQSRGGQRGEACEPYKCPISHTSPFNCSCLLPIECLDTNKNINAENSQTKAPILITIYHLDRTRVKTGTLKNSERSLFLTCRSHQTLCSTPWAEVL